MVSPGAEVQLGINWWLLGIDTLYSQYFDSVYPCPVDLVAFGHRTLNMIRFEDDAVGIAYINNHMLAPWVEPRFSNQEILRGCGGPLLGRV